MKKYFVIVLLCLGLFSNALAQDEVNFSVTASSDTILLGNYIEVSFSLENASPRNFEAPNFKGFDIVSGPNQSSSFSMMNGVTKQSMTYSYYVKPKEVGIFFIEPSFIEADEENLSTQPIEIIVLDNPDGIIQKPQRRQSPQMDFFNFPSDDFFNFPSDDFFNRKKVIPKSEDGTKPKKKKKKRKVYKI